MLNNDNILLFVLKNIQADITSMKKDIHELKEMKEQMDAVGLYVTYTVGMHKKTL
jgi:hypothetical protein